MKKGLLSIVILALTCGNFIVALAQDKGEFAVPFSDPAKRGKVNVDIKSGFIEVVGTSRKDVMVSYEKKNSHGKKSTERTDGLKRISAGTLDLEVSENNNLIDIESSSWGSGVNLKIEVPTNVDLHVETYNDGYVMISNVNGEIVAENYNGKITAENISGSLVADTYNGSINATFVKVSPDTPMAFTTYNGNVDLTFPSTVKASLKMKSAQGEVLSGFDFTVKKNEPITKTEKKSGTYKVYLDDWVRGDINGGGAEFMIKNYNGDIYLRKK
ncbi:DUF4097 family beta strand repeat-containing protein [Fulvivirga ligni]|uniref:DUF4097 family beta strand repeat-containing protein n=1 Tax=Fulvivirga ligni TaxID=2904246 RepID=UPI001F3DC585|nr:hypothetical protein [Fulvivirga ligni]UII23836.1 hypothetical protein LVD16_11450 [Fulvivirga ligni]